MHACIHYYEFVLINQQHHCLFDFGLGVVRRRLIFFGYLWTVKQARH